MGRIYPQEFRDQVVVLHRRDGRTFAEIAEEFSLSATTVAKWVRGAEDAERPKKSKRGEDSVVAEESDRERITRLERELAKRTEEVEILGKSFGLLRSTVGAVDIYRYIQAEKAKNSKRSIGRLCRVLGVLRLGLLRLGQAAARAAARSGGGRFRTARPNPADSRPVRLLRRTSDPSHAARQGHCRGTASRGPADAPARHPGSPRADQGPTPFGAAGATARCR